MAKVRGIVHKRKPTRSIFLLVAQEKYSWNDADTRKIGMLHVYCMRSVVRATTLKMLGSTTMHGAGMKLVLDIGCSRDLSKVLELEVASY